MKGERGGGGVGEGGREVLFLVVVLASLTVPMR